MEIFNWLIFTLVFTKGFNIIFINFDDILLFLYAYYKIKVEFFNWLG
jgi:hypothetical protein